MYSCLIMLTHLPRFMFLKCLLICIPVRILVQCRKTQVILLAVPLAEFTFAMATSKLCHSLYSYNTNLVHVPCIGWDDGGLRIDFWLLSGSAFDLPTLFADRWDCALDNLQSQHRFSHARQPYIHRMWRTEELRHIRNPGVVFN